VSTPARKKPRLEEPLLPLPTTTDEAAIKTASPKISVGLHLPVVDNDDANANTDPVMDIQPNNTGVTRCWTPEEDAELTSVVAKTCKKNIDQEYRIDGVAVAELVPGRPRIQWCDVLDLSIPLRARRTGQWTEDEDLKLKKSVQMHGDKDWAAVAELVPGRTQEQCRNRWQYVLDPSVAVRARCTSKWAEDEDLKLKKAVQMHGDKDWAAVAELVPGRTQEQCRNRWQYVLDPSITLTARRTGKWTEDEDLKLKKAVQMHGGKEWVAIATLVPGRTQKQCRNRWHLVVHIDRNIVTTKLVNKTKLVIKMLYRND
jgi:hypothetical protein